MVEDHVHGIVLMSLETGILKLAKHLFVDTLCYSVAIMHLFSQSLSIVL